MDQYGWPSLQKNTGISLINFNEAHGQFHACVLLNSERIGSTLLVQNKTRAPPPNASEF